MLDKTILKRLQCLGNGVVIEKVHVAFDDAVSGPEQAPAAGAVAAIVIDVRPRAGTRARCGRCRRISPGYDHGSRRSWRGLDMGTVPTRIRARLGRVRCREHGVVAAAVPWARHGAGHTRAFDDTVAWMATVLNKSALSQYLRIAWRTVGSIIARVEADFSARTDRLANLRRIGIDEISYKRNHKYLVVVVDHDSGRLVWAAPGRDKLTLGRFFTALGTDRCAQLTHISADGADWIADMVALRAPNALLCMDPFHVVAWVQDAVEQVRRLQWNKIRAVAAQQHAVLLAARAAGTVPAAPGPARTPGSTRDQHQPPARSAQSRRMRQARWAVLKNPENLNQQQRETLAWIAEDHPELHRTYQLKEDLRMVFAIKGQAGVAALDVWIEKALRCGIDPVQKVARRIDDYSDRIRDALLSGVSNGLVESTNTKIRAITRAAFGFRKPEHLIALALLARGGSRPDLPGRK